LALLWGNEWAQLSVKLSSLTHRLWCQ
jgi:hypothetical protein